MVVDGKPSALRWRKSTFSENGACVEVALHATGAHVRNTRNRAGGSLAFSPSRWQDFLRFVADR
ncbi:MAG: DUF397 domain-containing protein [Saccharothrix sp.]|nr:DUF397 domain-containing protein [Saccharothrix sp.]